jgi:hypothetical protein
METWKAHLYRIGSKQEESDTLGADPETYRKHIEPWLASVLQSEHLSILLGSGLTIGVATLAGGKATLMSPKSFTSGLSREIDEYSAKIAKDCGRGRPNIEDQIHAANQLLGGLEILKDARQTALRDDLDNILSDFLRSLLASEKSILGGDQLQDAENSLQSFLLSFASRTASRGRLNIFTTNYDRVIEYGCDLAGLHMLDRFVGSLYPIFRSSRLNIDLHYNPPGIRGEPRYLEGVVRITKLHGSIDWLWDEGEIRRQRMPFGADFGKLAFPKKISDSVMIYPNPAKDVETLNYPYAELFRDMSAALCRPNSALFTYGYGFGDDHINRVLRDMLTIPSTHLVIASYADSDQRIQRFCESAGREAQISLLIGEHFGALDNLTQYYLPKPAIDIISARRTELLARRGSTPASSGLVP